MKGKFERLSVLSLFVQTFYISAFALGGGYVMIPMMRERFAQKLGWIDIEELNSFITLGQSAPGAMIINSSVIMGYKLLGLGGAIAGALGTALPSVLMVMAIGFFYEQIRDNVYVSALFRGMLAAVAALIASTVIDMALPHFKAEKKALSLTIMAVAFIAAFVLQINIGLIIAACVLLGLVLNLFDKKRGEEK